MDEIQEYTNSLVPILFEKESKEYADALEAMSIEVETMLSNSPDLLFSYLYRLDVDENKIKLAMSPFTEEFPNIGLARLIIDRQLLRIKTQQEYSQKK